MARIQVQKRPFSLGMKMVFYCIAGVLLPPFVVLAIAPMVLMLLPVALIAIPFVLSAFAGEAREVQPMSQGRVRELQHAHS